MGTKAFIEWNKSPLINIFPSKGEIRQTA
jgi:hypothetical protein